MVVRARLRVAYVLCLAAPSIHVGIGLRSVAATDSNGTAACHSPPPRSMSGQRAPISCIDPGAPLTSAVQPPMETYARSRACGPLGLARLCQRIRRPSAAYGCNHACLEIVDVCLSSMPLSNKRRVVGGRQACTCMPPPPLNPMACCMPSHGTGVASSPPRWAYHYARNTLQPRPTMR